MMQPWHDFSKIYRDWESHVCRNFIDSDWCIVKWEVRVGPISLPFAMIQTFAATEMALEIFISPVCFDLEFI